MSVIDDFYAAPQLRLHRASFEPQPTVVRLKRSGESGMEPDKLKPTEWAINTVDRRIWIGSKEGNVEVELRLKEAENA